MLIHLNELPPLRRLGVTRRHLLEELDRPVLKPLPAEPYVYAEWRLRRAGLDYHIDVDGHYYSVPHRFANEELSVRLTARMVEVFRKGERIAVHLRGSGNHKHTTVQEHMPSSHRRFADWTIEGIHRDAAAIGVSTKMLCRLILESRQHPEQGFRACWASSGSSNPIAAHASKPPACGALEIGARTYGSVKSILLNNLDRQAATRRAWPASSHRPPWRQRVPSNA
jgi:transposase